MPSAPTTPPAPRRDGPVAPHEPRLARVAALVADPTRSRMLAYLLSGEAASAGELARAASVTPATASGHLAQLLDGQLVACEPRGRHRYYRLADAEVAHALEALALVAERGTHDRAWASPARQRLREARCCYGHLAGRLGVALYDSLRRAQDLGPVDAMGGHGQDAGRDDGSLALTPAGQQWLQTQLGFQPAAPKAHRRYAYACLDWSERRDHLAGQLAAELLRHCLDQGWLQRGAGRDVALTPRGRQQLLPVLGQSAG